MVEREKFKIKGEKFWVEGMGHGNQQTNKLS